MLVYYCSYSKEVCQTACGVGVEPDALESRLDDGCGDDVMDLLPVVAQPGSHAGDLSENPP
jgi:hypothetical protein